MFTRSNLKTPNLKFKKKKPQIAQSWENKIEDPLIAQSLQKNWKKKNGRLQKLRTKLKNPKHTKTKPPLFTKQICEDLME
jgi:hypothetical protein